MLRHNVKLAFKTHSTKDEAIPLQNRKGEKTVWVGSSTATGSGYIYMYSGDHRVAIRCKDHSCELDNVLFDWRIRLSHQYTDGQKTGEYVNEIF